VDLRPGKDPVVILSLASLNEMGSFYRLLLPSFFQSLPITPLMQVWKFAIKTVLYTFKAAAGNLA